MRDLLTKVFASVLVVSLAVPAVAEEPIRNSEPIWLAIHNPPSKDNKGMQVRIVGGTDMTIVEAIAECLETISDDPVSVVPSSELNLNFGSDSYLVIRLDKSKASLAAGPRFPLATTRALAKQVKGLGITEVKVFAPEELLRRVSSPDPFLRAFVTTSKSSSKSQRSSKLPAQ
jgi:hypothetical protein